VHKILECRQEPDFKTFLEYFIFLKTLFNQPGQSGYFMSPNRLKTESILFKELAVKRCLAAEQLMKLLRPAILHAPYTLKTL
jgi:hypothetical protein